MNFFPILVLLIWFPSVTSANEETVIDEDDLIEEGIPLTEEDPHVDEDPNEIEVNERSGVDAFEGDIMMTAEQWEELKKEFERTGQPMPP